jgi:hypothetical protein
LRELAQNAVLEEKDVISGHLHRHDFSRWITKVYDDNDLAREVKKLGSHHYHDRTLTIFSAQLSAIIEERYSHTI